MPTTLSARSAHSHQTRRLAAVDVGGDRRGGDGHQLMEFSILGPLEVRQNGAAVPIGGPRECTILAMLLLEVDLVVPVTTLIDAVWPDEPPTTARNQVVNCISNLRRALADGGQSLIVTRSPGYVLRLNGSSLDAREFEDRVIQARNSLASGHADEAAERFRKALSLWRGVALSNDNSPVVQQRVASLAERRLTVLEECLEAELAVSSGRDLVAELITATLEYPLRERFWGLLMTALCYAGRPAEALDVYRTFRGMLREELGIEPSAGLRHLHQTILTGGVSTRPVNQRRPAEDAGHEVRPVAVKSSGLAPMLLPPTIFDFSGRAALVRRVSTAFVGTDRAAPGAAPRLAVISGPGGAGKTTAAVYLAHRLAPEFPDGQLFARLQSGGRPVDPGDVLGRFLQTLGVDGSALHEGTEERAEIFRDLLGRRRMLIVLDDVMSEEQLATLLPGNAECAVIVTSRRRLTGLPTALRFEIGGLSRQDAASMLAGIVGADRAAAEPDQVERLCELCGCLPLALRIAGARLAAQPHRQIGGLVARMLDASDRLDVLNYGAMGMRGSITSSYDALSPRARALFRRLAISNAPTFDAWIGAPLLETDVLHAEDLMEELAEAYLLDAERVAGTDRVRYRFPSITRPFARERLIEEESQQARHEALGRVLEGLLYLADEAKRRESPGEEMLSSSDARRWQLPAHVVDWLLAEPLGWFQREHRTLTAGVRQAAAGGFSEYAWCLALCCVTLFESGSLFADWQETHEIALSAACHAEDLQGEAAMRYSLGHLYMAKRDNESAVDHFARAADLYSRLGDQHAAGLAVRGIALVSGPTGDLARIPRSSKQCVAIA